MVNNSTFSIFNWYKKHLFLLLFLPFYSFGQQETLFYKLTFTDKNFSTYSISNPHAFLSQRAIDRRSKFNITITDEDLPVSQYYVDSVLTMPNVNWKNQSKWLNTLIITCGDTNQINTIKTWSFVANVQQTKIKKLKGSPKMEMDWEQKKTFIQVNPHYPYGKTYNQNHLHQIDYLHDIELKGQGMHIAIIDAGFLNANQLVGLENVFAENRILSTKDFVAHDGDVYNDHYHGAAVLSVIAGNIEGEFYGTAPQASFHLLRTEDADAEYILEEDFWVSAAEYADSAGADIINTSLGYTTFDDSTTNHQFADLDGNTTVIAKGTNIAFSKGMLLCTSAGNLGDAPWGHIATPADATAALTVGAVDSLGIRGSFSSYGYNANGEVKPNVMTVGFNTYLIAPWDGTIIRGNGTSFSAPMLSGMAACLWQALPDKSNLEIKSMIEKSSTQYNSPDSLMGYGIPNFYQAYHDVTGLNYQVSTDLKIHNVYPNPFDQLGSLSILISSGNTQVIQLQWIDALGKIVAQNTFAVEQGKNQVTVSQSNFLETGVYRLRFIEEDGDVLQYSLVVGF